MQNFKRPLDPGRALLTAANADLKFQRRIGWPAQPECAPHLTPLIEGQRLLAAERRKSRVAVIVALLGQPAKQPRALARFGRQAPDRRAQEPLADRIKKPAEDISGSRNPTAAPGRTRGAASCGTRFQTSAAQPLITHDASFVLVSGEPAAAIGRFPGRDPVGMEIGHLPRHLKRDVRTLGGTARATFEPRGSPIARRQKGGHAVTP